MNVVLIVEGSICCDSNCEVKVVFFSNFKNCYK